MKVRVIKVYSDTTKNKELIMVGTEFEVPTERGNVLIKAGVAEEIKETNKKSK